MKKKPQTGEFRNLQKMPGSELYQFEVKDSKGNWLTMTNVYGSSEEVLQAFAQKTADGWRKK